MAQPLAIDGGTPLRTEPFPPWPHFTEDVVEAAMQSAIGLKELEQIETRNLPRRAHNAEACAR